MALTTCKECGGKMSDHATECPHCGCPSEFQGEIHPADNSSTQSKKTVSEQSQPSPKKPRKVLWISIAAILVVALSLGVVLFFGWGKTLGGTQTLKITPEFTQALQRYDQIDAFSEGMAAVRRDGKWGYINLQGEEVIPCQFSDAFPPGQFSEGLACVVDDGSEKDKKLWNKRVGFINKKGEFVITGDYFTEAPAGAVWEDESHKLPSFKDGKCAVWNTAVFSLEGEGTESGWSKEYESNKIVLIDSKGKISQAHDSLAYQLANYHPYVIPTPYKDVLTPIETKVAFDDYAVNIARDTVECDNGAKLVTWQIIDANSYPYGMYGGTYEKTCQYYIDLHGNTTLTPELEKSMEQHLNELMTTLLNEHNEQVRREEEEERKRREGTPVTITLSAELDDHRISNRSSSVGLCGSGVGSLDRLATSTIIVPENQVYVFKRYEVSPKDGWQYTVLHIARNGYWNTVNLKTSGEFSIYGGEKFYIALENPWGYGRQKVSVNATFYFTEKNSEY